MKSKNQLLYAATFFIATSFGLLRAQSITNAEFGIKGGANMSNLYSGNVDDKNALYGFNAGVYAAFPIADNIFIQPEILYTTKGAELKYNNAFVNGTGRFRLDYIEVPLLVRINVTKNFNVHFGGYAAYLVDGKVTNETNNGSFNFEDNINTDDFNKFDAGIAAGVGVDFDPLSIGLRYNYGLTTVGKERSFLGTTYTFPDSKNSNLSLYVAYKLN
ncbi:PorT family protein [Flavobacterium sp. LS1R49]|uniref:PorT family protein n=1 Tax=Flavobacterium shii TaxID=2987687 RepID=A0A9X2ZBR8_9FLAO|nr:porin family protein [Flavobacterium shii]MCV9928381.1 PorT family protein [Flavobacterium shii]